MNSKIDFERCPLECGTINVFLAVPTRKSERPSARLYGSRNRVERETLADRVLQLPSNAEFSER